MLLRGDGGEANGLPWLGCSYVPCHPCHKLLAVADDEDSSRVGMAAGPGGPRPACLNPPGSVPPHGSVRWRGSGVDAGADVVAGSASVTRSMGIIWSGRMDDDCSPLSITANEFAAGDGCICVEDWETSS